jgi:error-prone DNA polymerase
VKGLREYAARALVAARGRAAVHFGVRGGRRAGLDREELANLASIGAFAALGGTRRATLWAVAPADPGPLFTETQRVLARHRSREMSADERLAADYAGTGVTVGPHPMALRRATLAAAGVTRASDLANVAARARVRVAGERDRASAARTAKGSCS